MGVVTTQPDYTAQDAATYKATLDGSIGELDAAASAARGNVVVNGCMRVAQRAALALSTSFGFGAVDRWSVAAVGTVGAGSVTQAADSDFVSGYCLHLSGVTLSGGSEAVSARTRIEAKDAQGLAGQTGSLRVRIKHDLGAAATATVTINKADAADSFGSVTQIAQTTAAIPTGVATDVLIEGQALGACGNGLEVIISLATGACTTKKVYIGDVQLEALSWARGMAIRHLGVELARCLRYFRKSHRTADAPGAANLYGVVYTLHGGTVYNGSYFHAVNFAVPMRTAPTVTFYDPTSGASGSWRHGGGSAVVMAAGYVGDSGFICQNNSGADISGTSIYGHYTADAEL